MFLNLTLRKKKLNPQHKCQKTLRESGTEPYDFLWGLTFYRGQNEESNEGVVDSAGRLGNTRQDRVGI